MASSKKPPRKSTPPRGTRRPSSPPRRITPPGGVVRLSLPPKGLTEKRILLVDDEPPILAGLRRYFRTVDPTLNIHCAVTAQDGFDLITQYPNARWFVITDKDMTFNPTDAIKSGVELIAAIRKHLPPIAAYIVLNTGDDRFSPDQSKNGPDTFIRKPPDRKDLLKEYMTFLERTSRQTP